MFILIGYITNRTLLPITKIHFGRTFSSMSSGRHTIGPLECSGNLPFQGLPSSCEDLKRIGHTLSGFYSIKHKKSLGQVYCDMSKLPGDRGNCLFAHFLISRKDLDLDFVL